MVKLYTDEEMLEKCKLYQPIPLAMEQKVLHYEGNPNNINILNGVIKSPYKTGQPVDSIINYAHQLEQNLPVSADVFISAYEKALDEEIKKGTKKVMDELLEKLEMEEDIKDEPEYAESARAAPDYLYEDLAVEPLAESITSILKFDDEAESKRTRRTKQQMTEAREMGEEDKYPGGKV